MNNTLYRIASIILLLIFYSIYIIKMVRQRRKGIQTNQMGKGDKTRKTLMVERTLNIVSWLIVLVQLVSIGMNMTLLPNGIRLVGIAFGVVGDIFFGISVYTMRDSWRAGIPAEEKTKMVTSGIYGISRNPAFLGFYLLYIGVLLIYCNWFLLGATVLTVLVFHLQVLQEETFLKKTFGAEYDLYQKKVCRYLGRRRAK